MKYLLVAFVLCAALLVSAAQPEGYAYYSSAQLKAYEQKLAPKVNPLKFANEQIGSFGSHSLLATYRKGSGEAELHETQHDIFIVESGAATLVIGGKVVKGRSTGPGEIRGPSIEGGSKQKLGPGDVVNIKNNTAHQVLLDPGQTFTYVIVKVNAK
jgi:hypothetical protein